MTIFEEYLNSKREETKLEMEYSWAFHDFYNNMCDISKSKNNIHTCKESLDKLDNAKKQRIKLGEEICELSFLTDYQAIDMLPKIMKDMTFEDYEFKSLVIDDMRRVFLIKKGASLGENISMDNLLSNENVIFLASTNLKNGFHLYQNIPDSQDIGSELNVNFFNNESGILKKFIDGYICAKAERKEIHLEDYYLLVRDDIKHGYDEKLLEYYDLDDAYVEHFDAKTRREEKRRREDYYHKKQRYYINGVKEQEELAKLPSKYQPNYKVETLTFIRKLEIELGRRFSSLEKEIINSWLKLGYSEDIISVACREAQTRGTYNISSIAEILNGLITQKIMEVMSNEYKNKIQRSIDYLEEFGITKEDIVKLSKTLPTNDSTDDNK